MRTTVIFAALALAALGNAQDWSMELYYGTQAKQTAIVASTKVTTFTNVLGKGYTLDLDGFVGAYQSGSPVAGFSLGKRFPLADRVQGYLGLAFSVVQGKPNDFGPAFGVSVKF